ncbi:MAG: dihydrolipoamide acetyltransferase family protein [Alphaproteobacteria bacterium]
MGTYVIKLPDVGEGVAEAELVEWTVEVGAIVKEDDVLAAVMTDKATVEIPSPVEGTVTWLGGAVGDVIAVGSPIVRLDVDGAGNETARTGETPPVEAPVEAADQVQAPDLAAARAPETQDAPENPAASREAASASASRAPAQTKPAPAASPTIGAPVAAAGPLRAEGDKPIASPAVRRRARDAGVDLRQVRGTGPAGRITHDDLDVWIQQGGPIAGVGAGPMPDTTSQDIKVVGLRRRIAEKMAIAKSRIPHITYVDEVDMTALEGLRTTLNTERRDDQPKLTVLPFLMKAMAAAIKAQPQLNAVFDDEAGVIHQFGGMHMGIATQTPNGLVVPVVRHVEARDIWACAVEVSRLADAARDGTATREELTGSTITITSLGTLGGIVTTPVINHPEVAIIGVNKMQVRPVWDGTQFIPRRMMNLSSSFDHRVIDGWDAAVFIQKIKGLLENPARIFMEA